MSLTEIQAKLLDEMFQQSELLDEVAWVPAGLTLIDDPAGAFCPHCECATDYSHAQLGDICLLCYAISPDYVELLVKLLYDDIEASFVSVAVADPPTPTLQPTLEEP
jgi:hypothetical protein